MLLVKKKDTDKASYKKYFSARELRKRNTVDYLFPCIRGCKFTLQNDENKEEKVIALNNHISIRYWHKREKRR